MKGKIPAMKTSWIYLIMPSYSVYRKPKVRSKWLTIDDIIPLENSQDLEVYASVSTNLWSKGPNILTTPTVLISKPLNYSKMSSSSEKTL